MPKQIILILLILCLGMGALQAQKCKYAFDKTDPMSGERVRRAEIKLKSYYIVSYYRKADSFRVELNVQFAGERNFAVSEGAEMQLKLGDGSILTFRTAQKATPVSFVAGAQVMTVYAMTYYCSKEQMEQIASHGFSVVSAKVGDETLTYEVKAKDVDDTAKKAACMLQ